MEQYLSTIAEINDPESRNALYADFGAHAKDHLQHYNKSVAFWKRIIYECTELGLLKIHNYEVDLDTIKRLAGLNIETASHNTQDFIYTCIDKNGLDIKFQMGDYLPAGLDSVISEMINNDEISRIDEYFQEQGYSSLISRFLGMFSISGNSKIANRDSNATSRGEFSSGGSELYDNKKSSNDGVENIFVVNRYVKKICQRILKKQAERTVFPVLDRLMTVQQFREIFEGCLGEQGAEKNTFQDTKDTNNIIDKAGRTDMLTRELNEVDCQIILYALRRDKKIAVGTSGIDRNTVVIKFIDGSSSPGAETEAEEQIVNHADFQIVNILLMVEKVNKQVEQLQDKVKSLLKEIDLKKRLNQSNLQSEDTLSTENTEKSVNIIDIPGMKQKLKLLYYLNKVMIPQREQLGENLRGVITQIQNISDNISSYKVYQDTISVLKTLQTYHPSSAARNDVNGEQSGILATIGFGLGILGRSKDKNSVKTLSVDDVQQAFDELSELLEEQNEISDIITAHGKLMARSASSSYNPETNAKNEFEEYINDNNIDDDIQAEYNKMLGEIQSTQTKKASADTLLASVTSQDIISSNSQIEIVKDSSAKDTIGDVSSHQNLTESQLTNTKNAKNDVHLELDQEVSPDMLEEPIPN